MLFQSIFMFYRRKSNNAVFEQSVRNLVRNMSEMRRPKIFASNVRSNLFTQ